ncbi:MAG: hypothetical protein PHR35_19390 [Kiritimatiellae bacterium]|nr:hypothetical protein [Kiritimatiellia bacterium]
MAKKMKRPINIVILALLTGVVLVGALTQRQIAIRYHVWQSGRLYSLAMAHFGDSAQREAYRSRSIQHSDALIRIGHWTNQLYRVRSIADQNERMELMKKIDRTFPRDRGYYQMWGDVGPTGPEAFITLWAEPAYVPMWEQFLKDENVLIKEEGQHPAAPYSDPAARSPQR